jgi:hypothetical protein
MPIMNMMECHHNPYRAGLRYVVQGDGVIIPTNRQVCSSSLALEVLGSRRGERCARATERLAGSLPATFGRGQVVVTRFLAAFNIAHDSIT